MSDSSNIVRMRGLPWSATEEEIRKFFDAVGSKIVKISFTLNKNGRKSGEAYVEFQSTDDVQFALTKHNVEMGKRYIEVFTATRAEMDFVLSKSGSKVAQNLSGRREFIVRLRGLPYGCTEDDVREFFTGLQIAPFGILFIFDDRGRQSGECYVKFVTGQDCEAAVAKDKATIGHRYIEVFRSSYSEAEKSLKKGNSEMDPSPNFTPRQGYSGGQGRHPMATGYGYDDPQASDHFTLKRRYGADDSRFYGERFSPYNSNNFASRGYVGGRGTAGIMKGGIASNSFFGGGRVGGSSTTVNHSVAVRGLPFNCCLNDIVELFHPLKIAGVSFAFDDDGRPSGEANVKFNSHNDAVQANDRNGSIIGGRYVDLYLNSEPDQDEPSTYSNQMSTHSNWLTNDYTSFYD